MKNFSHYGVKVREEPDFSFTLDLSAFCENIEHVVFQSRADHEPLQAEELTQLRGALSALQWRAHQTAPHLSARLGQLQSEISRATATAKATNKLIGSVLFHAMIPRESIKCMWMIPRKLFL